MIRWKIILKRLLGVKELLRLVKIEFYKLRRKKLIWIMLLPALIMPFFAFLYFGYLRAVNIDPRLFYKWSTFGFTLFIILPFILGLFGIMLMHDENRYDMLKQIWIVPISKMGYFFSKFFVVLIYSILFMLITALATVIFSANYVAFEWNNIFFLLERCLEIAVLTSVAILPLLAISSSQKGYIFPVCSTLLYVFAGFLITPINSCLHPISCISVIISRNEAILGLTLPQTSIPIAFLSILIWCIFSVLFANYQLSKRK